jgi:hypothetical protein
MSKYPSALESIERQLRVHHLRLVRLREWRDAVVELLRRCERDEGSRRKAMDTTPSAETLEYERDTLEREMRAHEILIALGRDRQALELLETVVADLSLAREAAADPRAFAEARGVQLPRNMAVRVNIIADRVSVELDYIDRSCAASLTFPD